MAGETELHKLLAGMRPQMQPGEFVFCSISPERFADLRVEPVGWFREPEGITVILPRRAAESVGLACEFPSRMITLGVHSSLHAVGFLAAVLARLAAASVSVNVVSGYHHDHLFVPAASADAALSALQALSAEPR